MHAPHRQTGATLVVSLLLLLVLTVLAVSVINSTSVDLRIARNMQYQQEVEAAAQQTIEQVLSSSANFRAPLPPDATATVGGVQVTARTPRCLGETIPPGFSVDYSIATAVGWSRTHWQLTAEAVDPGSGARAVLHEGVVIMLSKGNCP